MKCKECLRYLKSIAKADFKKRTVINKNIVAIHRKQLFIKLNKPIINGMCILDILDTSKYLMYTFYYKTMKYQYGENIILLFSDTDSIWFDVKTNDLYEDRKNNKDLYDFPSIQKHILYDETNKKRVRIMKDETKSNPMQEFIGMRPKIYSIKTCVKNEIKEKTNQRGLKKA